MGLNSSKVWGKEQILSIIHTTTEENLIKILKEGYIHTPYSKDKDKDFKISRKKFPGIYCSVNTIYDVNKKNNNPITLVLSTKLLDSYNYHFNLIQNDGYINENTLVNQTLHLYPPQNDIETFFLNYKGNELVFHDEIPVDCIEEIWVSKSLFIKDNSVAVRTGKITTEYLKHVLYNHNLGKYVDILKKVRKIPDKKYNKEVHIDVFKKPYLCFFIDKNSVYNKHFDFNIKENHNLIIPFVYRNVLSSKSKPSVLKKIAEYGGIKTESTDIKEIEKEMVNSGCIQKMFYDRKSQSINVYPPFLELYDF